MSGVSAARELKLLAKQADQIALRCAIKIQTELGKLSAIDQAKGMPDQIKKYLDETDKIEGEMFNIYRGVYTGQQPPGEPDWQNMMLDSVAHDLEYIREEIGMSLGFYVEDIEGPLSPSVEAAVKRLVERAKEYLLFSNYALRIMAALASQQECLSPGFSRLNLQEIFEVIALSGVFRSLIYRERNIDFRIGEYAPEKAADPGYVGVLMHLEPGLQLRTIEPYVTSVFYNLVKNAFKIMLWNPQGEPVPGAKVVVSAVTHPKYPSVAVVEIIDNGPGFDLKTIAQQALFVSDSTPVAAGLPAELRDSLRRMNGSPYAYALSVNELMRMVFLYRLTTAGGGGFGSGLGLYGANQFLTQLHGSCVVGMNHAKTEPFHTGARFMFFIPKDPYAFMPDLNLLTRDMEYGALDTPVFCG